MKFIQITDTHFVPPGETLLGLDPKARLQACIADVNENHADAKLCVLTGDLANHGKLEAYESLRDTLSTLRLPYYLLVGNHDNRENFKRIFDNVPCDENGFVQSVVDTSGGRFILLDSVEPGQRWGSFCERRATWLETQLAQTGDIPVYLFIHHPPFEIGIPSLDYIRLRDPSYFQKVVSRHKNIRHMFLGHLHRPISGSWLGIPYSMLPSTVHQVTFDFEIVNPVPKNQQPPAYAVVFLRQDTVIVHLHDYLDTSALAVSDIERLGAGHREILPFSVQLQRNPHSSR